MALQDNSGGQEDSLLQRHTPPFNPLEKRMKTSVKARIAALAASALVTLLLVAEVADYAIPQATVLLVASSAR